MPFDGSGNYTPAAAPNFPAVAGETISAAYYNAVINDIAAALSNCLTRDGQGKPAIGIDWNAKNLTNVATFSAAAGTVGGSAIVTTGVYTPADVLAKLLIVDGAGSGLDADLLDGIQGSAFLQIANLLTTILNIDGSGSGIDADLLDGQQGAYYLPAGSYTAADVLAKLLTVDGAGSGLDADLLDGVQSGAFLQTVNLLTTILSIDGAGSGIDADLLDGAQGAAYALLASSPTFTGSVSDSIGNVRKMIKSSETSGVLTTVSAQQLVRATGSVTINNAVFSANDWISVLNKSGGNITITQGSGVTFTSADGLSGSRTLANNGWITLWFNTSSDVHITGAGLS